MDLFKAGFYYRLSLFAAASFMQDREQSFFSNIGNRKLDLGAPRRRDQFLFQITQAAFFVLADQIAI
jgi:hypothetical protein